MLMQRDDGSPGRRLVLVIGSSRSGTSAVSAALAMLGLNVPGPYLKANASNPKGFYESRWSVRFHNSLLRRATVSINDARLTAPALLVDAAGPKRRERLQRWLARVTAGSSQTVVKDPRAVFALELWEECAAASGLDVGYVVMLRHPSEVVGSRATYYGDEQGAASRRFATKNLAGWVAATLIAERMTRHHPRVLLRYDDLLADWRSAMGSVRDALALSYDVELAAGVGHPLDEFIEPGLSRHSTGWDGIDAPAELIGLAEQVWEAGSRTASGHVAQAELDELWAGYDAMYDRARALVQDDTAAAVSLARAQAAEQVAEAAARSARRRPWRGSRR